MSRLTIFISFLVCCYITQLQAHEAKTDSLISNEDKAVLKNYQKTANKERNLHYNILGGPGYTPDFGLVLGGTALMTFRMNPSDTLQQRSVLPLVLSYMFKSSGLTQWYVRNYSSAMTVFAFLVYSVGKILSRTTMA